MQTNRPTPFLHKIIPTRQRRSGGTSQNFGILRIKNYVIVPRCIHVDYATLFCEREVIKFVKYVVKDYQKLKPIIGYEFYNRKPMLFMHMTGNCDT